METKLDVVLGALQPMADEGQRWSMEGWAALLRGCTTPQEAAGLFARWALPVAEHNTLAAPVTHRALTVARCMDLGLDTDAAGALLAECLDARDRAVLSARRSPAR